MSKRSKKPPATKPLRPPSRPRDSGAETAHRRAADERAFARAYRACRATDNSARTADHRRDAGKARSRSTVWVRATTDRPGRRGDGRRAYDDAARRSAGVGPADQAQRRARPLSRLRARATSRPASSRRLSDCWRRVRRPTRRQENYPPRKALKSQEARKSSGRPVIHRSVGSGSEAAAPNRKSTRETRTPPLTVIARSPCDEAIQGPRLLADPDPNVSARSYCRHDQHGQSWSISPRVRACGRRIRRARLTTGRPRHAEFGKFPLCHSRVSRKCRLGRGCGSCRWITAFAGMTTECGPHRHYLLN